MTIKVAINGFGRIGRLAYRRIKELNSTELEVVAVNDLVDNEDLAYLLKYDTAHGRLPYTVEVKENSLFVDGEEVKVYKEADASKLPWGELDIDIVLECTGFYVSSEKSNAHLEAGAKKVMISAPPKDDSTKIGVYGVNEKTLTKDDRIVSAASCTTNALALMTKVLVDEFGIQRGLMTGSRSYTATQSLQDAPGGRKKRAGAQNVIPATTGAAKALGKVIPKVNGIITGTSTRVPVITAGFVELYSVLDQEVTIDKINKAMKAASNEAYGYTQDEVVSSDIIGDTHGSTFDSTLTEVMDANGGQLVKTVAWYDNEYGFVSNMIRLLEYFANLN
ncbi:glyceraldehyde 3-phosphate dehydrogenase [Carnobacterium iners]|uniref:Glyceraldehyde-3-phosphate dehydrogenase n=1 Tax=Carnobacterium iners TaxID=1073423 RepID=A0A1X7MTR0_9LACT|nr:type I glyceraldehyde-3-phosphate dehydrogenase [Carnobacterium iners]SEK57242.1 glyceraldehyde 3-phosphate dehydrogenase [Carnobacterium iners]SMH28115.1 glyceraldehyde 3-phosphate dehydrogenase [Carnobacterium iners]